MTTTQHYIDRAKERQALNERRAERAAELAWSRGKAVDDMPSREGNFMRTKQGEGIKVIFYNDFLYIFTEESKCITMYEAPGWFGRKRHFDGKEKIRNVKKYMRNCCMAEAS